MTTGQAGSRPGSGRDGWDEKEAAAGAGDPPRARRGRGDLPGRPIELVVQELIEEGRVFRDHGADFIVKGDGWIGFLRHGRGKVQPAQNAAAVAARERSEAVVTLDAESRARVRAAVDEQRRHQVLDGGRPRGRRYVRGTVFRSGKG